MMTLETRGTDSETPAMSRRFVHWRDDAHLSIFCDFSSSATDTLATFQQPQREGEHANRQVG